MLFWFRSSKQRIARKRNSHTMGSDTAASYSANSSQMGSNFVDGLKELKNLRRQFYSAAEHFESSYNGHNHKQFVVESSKDYVAKALVSTVDHLGSLADKLSRFLDAKATEFSATKTQFSCIEQRLSTFQGFVNLRGLSQHLITMDAAGQHKHYIFPDADNFPLGKSKVLYKNCISCPPHDVQQLKQDNLFFRTFQSARLKPDSPRLRKEQSRMISREPSPNRLNFSFTKVVPNKESGRRSVSPFRFPLKRSETTTNRSVSPSLFYNKRQYPSEPRRALSASRRPETRNREIEIESYTKRSIHLFKALISVHHRPRKDILHKYRDN